MKTNISKDGWVGIIGGIGIIVIGYLPTFSFTEPQRIVLLGAGCAIVILSALFMGVVEEDANADNAHG